MAYILEEMLNVRKLREQIASDNVVKARSRLEDARREVVKAEKALEEYRIWAKQEEKRLYDKILNKDVLKSDINRIKYQVNQLKEKEIEYIDAIEQAKELVEQRKNELEEAKQAHQNAIKNVQKLEDHKEGWLEEDRKERERLQDLEMEEFKNQTPQI